MSGLEQQDVETLHAVVRIADEKAAERICHLLALVLEGDEGLRTLSAESVDRPHFEQALEAARHRSPIGPRRLRER